MRKPRAGCARGRPRSGWATVLVDGRPVGHRVFVDGTRAPSIADDQTLESGLLHVDLVREILEAMKPRRILIGGGANGVPHGGLRVYTAPPGPGDEAGNRSRQKETRMNAEVWAIISVGVALGGLIVALAGLMWTMLRSMRQDMDRRFQEVDRRFDGVDKRFDGVDRRLDGVDKRFDGIDKRLDGLAEDHNGLSRELSELRGELRGRLDERARPPPPPS